MRAAVLLAALVTAASGPATAQDGCEQIQCGQPFPQGMSALICSPTQIAAANDVCEAYRCLLGASAFMSDPKGRILSGAATFDEILPALYEVGSDSKGYTYSETRVNSVLAWANSRRAAGRADVCLAEQLQYEASFRKASAHGMFGDDRLLRALDPVFVRGLTAISNDPHVPPLLLLDSRACRNAANPSKGGDLCNTDADCEDGETCEPCRFAGDHSCHFEETPRVATCVQDDPPDAVIGDNACPMLPRNRCNSAADCPSGVRCISPSIPPIPAGSALPPGECERAHEACISCGESGSLQCESDCNLTGATNARAYGAIQEYRRGEQALVEAAKELGFDRFRQIDVASGCRGGCAGALLLHFGAMKMRAQAQRLELLWTRAMVRGWPPPAASCTNSSSWGMRCNLDGDCDAEQPYEMGRCAAGGTPERGFVQLRQAADEAFTEAAAADAVYNSLIAPQVLATSADLNLILTAMTEMNEIINRAVAGLTPFGLPSDFVPFLSTEQRSFLKCFVCGANESGCSSNAVSVVECLETVAQGDPKWTGVLKDASNLQQSAQFNADRMTKAMREAKRTSVDLNNKMEELAIRMFGTPCAEAACDCSEDDFARGRCARLTVFTNTQGTVSTTKFWRVEGLKCDDPSEVLCGPSAVQSDAGVGMVDGEMEIALQVIHRNRLSLANMESRLDRVEEERDHTLDGIARRQGVTTTECDTIESAITDAGSRISSKIEGKKRSSDEIRKLAQSAAASAAIAGYAIGLTEKLQGDNYVKAAALGALAYEQTRVAAERENKLIDIEAAIQRVQTQRENQVNAAQCVSRQEFLNIDRDDALFSLHTTELDIEAKIAEQEQDVLLAVANVQQLSNTVRQRRAELEEARMLELVWGESGETSFRNPQNYRILAVEEQIGASEAFRRAQMTTWLILRATAYDLAQTDLLLPQRFIPSSRLTIPQCRSAKCSISGGRCRSRLDCPPQEDCLPTGTALAVAVSGADATCALQSVFAARSVDDLLDLIGAAKLAKLRDPRELACNGMCEKTLSLASLFTDPLPGGGESFGSLLNRLPTVNRAKQLDFAITLERGFEVCPELPQCASGIADPACQVPRVCQPMGVGGIGQDAVSFGAQLKLGSGPTNGGTAIERAWGQKLFAVSGLIRYRFGYEPTSQKCRYADSLKVVNPVIREQDCGRSCPPGRSCVWQSLLEAGNAPSVEISQLGPGLVRTREAARAFARMPTRVDSQLSYQIRKGDLLTDRAADFTPFSASLLLSSNPSTPNFSASFRGVPVASPRWQIRILSPLPFTSPSIRTATFLDSIEDIELTLRFQAFDP